MSARKAGIAERLRGLPKEKADLVSAPQRLWAFLERNARAVFGAVLVVETLVLAVLCRKGVVSDALDQFLLGIGELLRGSRITSTFLPVGYAAPVGWVERLVAAFGIRENYGLFLVGAATMLAIVVLTRQYLRRIGCPATLATFGALLLGCNPRLLFRVTCVEDTNLAALALIAILLTTVMLRRNPGPRWAVLGGLAFGGAVLIRPNLVVMAVPFLFSLWKQPVRLKALRLAQLFGTATLFYALITTTAHGRPFFPHNGPYNLFVGNNEFTAEALRTESNAEPSIEPAMLARGYPVVVHWKRQPDLPDVDDARDRRYAPIYLQQTAVFARQRPGEVLHLAVLKLYAFFYEEVGDAFAHSPAVIVAAVVVKLLAVLTIPVWFLLWFAVRARNRSVQAENHHDIHADWIVFSMAVLFVLPFVITNSAARFRPPLEALLLVDSCRLIYDLHRGLEKRKRVT